MYRRSCTLPKRSPNVSSLILRYRPSCLRHSPSRRKPRETALSTSLLPLSRRCLASRDINGAVLTGFPRSREIRRAETPQRIWISASSAACSRSSNKALLYQLACSRARRFEEKISKTEEYGWIRRYWKEIEEKGRGKISMERREDDGILGMNGGLVLRRLIRVIMED